MDSNNRHCKSLRKNYLSAIRNLLSGPQGDISRNIMADEHDAQSEEDEDSDNAIESAELHGELCKWTNYIHGWQTRFIILKDGTLSYYKSKDERGFGCRGALSLFKATIKPHEFDDCRFDVSVNDCVWYLRAKSAEDKQNWVDILEAFKVTLQKHVRPMEDVFYASAFNSVAYSKTFQTKEMDENLDGNYRDNFEE